MSDIHNSSTPNSLPSPPPALSFFSWYINSAYNDSSRGTWPWPFASSSLLLMKTSRARSICHIWGTRDTSYCPPPPPQSVRQKNRGGGGGAVAPPSSHLPLHSGQLPNSQTTHNFCMAVTQGNWQMRTHACSARARPSIGLRETETFMTTASDTSGNHMFNLSPGLHI